MLWLYSSLFFSLLLSAGLTSWLSGWALKRGIFVPAQRARDIHSQPIPRIGGLAIIITFIAIILTGRVFDKNLVTFTSDTVLGLDRNLLGVLLAVLLLSAVNVLDDLRGVSWPLRLLSQIVAAALVAAFGIKILWLSNPFGGQLLLGGLGYLFVIVWLVLTANVTNWLDGIDGLSSGVSAIALAVLFLLSIGPRVGQTSNAFLAIVGLGAVLGFLPFNLRGRAFLGDTGSVFLGFLIGVLAIISGGKVATAFLVMSIPFLDALVVVFSRLLAHQSPFLADQRHLHHRLLARGWQKWQIVLVFYGISLIFGLIALNTATIGKLWAVSIAVLIMVVFLIIVLPKKVEV